MNIQEKYQEACQTPSDINELLPKLNEYGSKCEHITEMGTRRGNSTLAFLAANPKRFVTYDLGKWDDVNMIEQLAKQEGRDFTFIQADVLKVEIEPTDMLFIDTFHTATQLEKELELHAGKVRKYLAFHDVKTFWENGETTYESVADKGTNCGRGLKYAINPFMAHHPEWKEVYRTNNNNGLLILERQA